jgi:hypothetical protein
LDLEVLLASFLKRLLNGCFEHSQLQSHYGKLANGLGLPLHPQHKIPIRPSFLTAANTRLYQNPNNFYPHRLLTRFKFAGWGNSMHKTEAGAGYASEKITPRLSLRTAEFKADAAVRQVGA